jgi:hypothetical protein
MSTTRAPTSESGSGRAERRVPTRDVTRHHRRAKCPLSDKEVRHFVDRALERSRATLVRDLRGILLRFVPVTGDGSTVGADMSRATLGAEASDVMGDSGETLATPSRGSLGVGRRP